MMKCFKSVDNNLLDSQTMLNDINILVVHTAGWKRTNNINANPKQSEG